MIALIVFLVFLCLYMVPSMVAFDRKIPNRWSVLVINVFLGWSLIGWAVALAMAVSGAGNH